MPTYTLVTLGRNKDYELQRIRSRYVQELGMTLVVTIIAVIVTSKYVTTLYEFILSGAEKTKGDYIIYVSIGVLLTLFLIVVWSFWVDLKKAHNLVQVADGTAEILSTITFDETGIHSVENGYEETIGWDTVYGCKLIREGKSNVIALYVRTSSDDVLLQHFDETEHPEFIDYLSEIRAKYEIPFEELIY